MMEQKTLESQAADLRKAGFFESVLERAEEMSKEITPDMTTEDILARAYIQGLVDAAGCFKEYRRLQEAKQ